MPELAGYMESINSSVMPVDEEIAVTEQDEFNEMIFLGLRKTEGIDTRLIPDKERLLKKQGRGRPEAPRPNRNRRQLPPPYRERSVMSTEVMVQILSEI